VANSAPETITLSPPELPDIPGPDFTFYMDAASAVAKKLLPDQDEKVSTQAEKYTRSHSPEMIVPKGEEGAETETYTGRALACSSYQGRYCSITIRSEKENSRKPRESDGWRARLEEIIDIESPPEPDGATPEERLKAKLKDLLGYLPKGYQPGDAQSPPDAIEVVAGDDKPLPPGEEIFLNSIHTLCRELRDILLDPSVAHPSGLIVVTGATNSSKSLITRGLLFLLLADAADAAARCGGRKPHLVTFEDPIEKFFIKPPEAESPPAATAAELARLLDAFYLDYTPRERHKDAANLVQVTKDALRQTPSALFVGETRERRDWEALLEFAGSGHLVVTTSHASSVVEAMSGIFRATDTKTPARRSETARRILGIVNVRGYTPPGTPSGTSLRALLPSVWKNTPQSMNNLIADGLASILPERDYKKKHRGVISCPGRLYFAERLTEDDLLTPKARKLRGWEERATGDYEAGPPRDTGRPTFFSDIKRKAIEWDLKGE
jgi:hypothetical protein